MSSLWTPEGEHRVPRPGETPAGGPEAPPPGAPSSASGPGSTGGTGATGAGATAPGVSAGEPSPATTASEAKLLQVARELAAAPAEDVIANHCYGLFELAALHLSQQPPSLDRGRLAIDAMGLLVDGLGERLGPHLETLTEGLSQLRLAYVKLAGAAPAANGQTGSGA